MTSEKKDIDAIVRFVRKKPRTYTEIYNYLTEHRKLNEKTAKNRIKAAKDSEKIFQKYKRGPYHVKQKCKTGKIDANTAKNFGDASNLLETILYIAYEIIKIDSYPVDKIRQNCNKFFVKNLKPILNKIKRSHHISSENSHVDSMKKLRNEHAIAEMPYSVIGIKGLAEFRRIFEKSVLDIRNRSIELHQKYEKNKTKEGKTIMKCSRLIFDSINNLCRVDLDLLIKGYTYNKKSNRFTILIKEEKMLVKHYDIMEVYCDGKQCLHNIQNYKKRTGNNNADFEIALEPCSVVNNNSIHMVTFRIDCIDFTCKLHGSTHPKEVNQCNENEGTPMIKFNPRLIWFDKL